MTYDIARIQSPAQELTYAVSEDKKNPKIMKAESLSSKIRKKKRMPLLPLLFNIILEVLNCAVTQEIEIKVISVRKKKLKLFLFTDDMILHTENAKDSIR